MRAIHLFSLIILLLLAGCTVVNIDGGRAIVHGGTLRLVAPENSEIIAIQSRGVGLIRGLGGATIGYQSESSVIKMADSSCVVIVFGANLDENGQNFWRGLAENHENICVK